MARPRKYKKQDILDAIKGSFGIVSNVAANMGTDWHTADDYIKLWPETQEALQEEREAYLDLAENSCIDRVKNGDGQMIRFVLATIGKKRGYSTTEETPAETTGEDTEVNISVEGGEPEPVEAQSEYK